MGENRTATAVVHTLFESLILLVSAKFFSSCVIPKSPELFGLRKLTFFWKFGALNVWFWIWIWHTRLQLENPYNLCAGCTLWVKNWWKGITFKLSIYDQFRPLKCIDCDFLRLDRPSVLVYLTQIVTIWVVRTDTTGVFDFSARNFRLPKRVLTFLRLSPPHTKPPVEVLLPDEN